MAHDTNTKETTAMDSFDSFVQEMHGWTDDQLRTHVSAMERRAIVHDDPACLDTARIAERILEDRAERRVAAAEWEAEAMAAQWDDDPNPYHGDYSEM